VGTPDSVQFAQDLVEAAGNEIRNRLISGGGGGERGWGWAEEDEAMSGMWGRKQASTSKGSRITTSSNGSQSFAGHRLSNDGSDFLDQGGDAGARRLNGGGTCAPLDHFDF
jgi:hypothetical protein